MVSTNNNNIDNNSQDTVPKKRNVVFDTIIGLAIGLTTCIGLNAIRGYFAHIPAKSILPEALKKTVDKDLGVSMVSGVFWLSDAIHHNKRIDALTKQGGPTFLPPEIPAKDQVR